MYCYGFLIKADQNRNIEFYMIKLLFRWLLSQVLTIKLKYSLWKNPIVV